MKMAIVFARAAALVVLLALSPLRAFAAEGGDFAPENILKTNSRMGWICMVYCPVSAQVRSVIVKSIGNDRDAQYLLGLTLLTGDGLPTDRAAGIAWIVKAAEQGNPSAARDIASRLRNGAGINVDETKVADALRPAALGGDTEAMRALGPMIMGGRGTKQDAAAGIAMIKAAADKGSAPAEQDLSNLYLRGAPGLAQNRPEAMRWLAASARHGNINAMVSLGYMSVNASGNERNLAEGYCWLMRAALLDNVQAHEKLTSILESGEKDDRGTVIPGDLIQADYWFRLAARSPYHDNSQIRAAIEPKMTTAQIDEAKRLFAAWQPRKLEELKSITIPLPGTARSCPAFG